MNNYDQQKHADDLDELRFKEFEQRRIERDNELCGFVPQEGENNAD